MLPTLALVVWTAISSCLAQYGDQARVQTVGGRCHVLKLNQTARLLEAGTDCVRQLPSLIGRYRKFDPEISYSRANRSAM
jgi:hypothetical protein